MSSIDSYEDDDLTLDDFIVIDESSPNPIQEQEVPQPAQEEVPQPIQEEISQPVQEQEVPQPDQEQEVAQPVQEQEVSQPIQEEISQPVQEEEQQKLELPESDSYMLEDFLCAEAITTPNCTPIIPNVDTTIPLLSISEPVQEEVIKSVPEEVTQTIQEEIVQPVQENKVEIVVSEPDPVVEVASISRQVELLQELYQEAKQTQPNKVWNIEQSIQGLSSNPVICMTHFYLIHTLSALLTRSDSIVQICSAGTESILQLLMQEFPGRIRLTSLPYEQLETEKQRFQMICFGNCLADHILLSQFLKGWRASGSRCIWIVEDTHYPVVMKTLLQFLQMKDFVNEFSFDLRSGDHWLGQVEK